MSDIADSNPQNKGSPTSSEDLDMVEASLTLTEFVPIMMSRPAKRALKRLAARRQTNLSSLVREAVTKWIEREYPEYREMYAKELQAELERRKRRNDE